MVNWRFGWGLVLAGFVSGAILGLFFARDDFLGGYNSFRRRLVRLGHIALVALGLINVLYSVSLHTVPGLVPSHVASVGLMVGGLTMPLACFLAAWKPVLRHLFPIPVAALIAAVVQILRDGGR